MWAGYIWMIVFGIFFGVLFFVMQWLTHGFILKFMGVKGSREKKIMVKVRSKLGDYIAVGRVHEREVSFKKRYSKMKSTLNIPIDGDGRIEKVFYRFLGVYWCDVDEEKNSFCTVSYNAVVGFDDERQEGLILRALFKPSPIGMREKIILLLLIGVLLGIVVIGIMTYQNYDVLRSMNVVGGVIP